MELHAVNKKHEEREREREGGGGGGERERERRGREREREREREHCLSVYLTNRCTNVDHCEGHFHLVQSVLEVELFYGNLPSACQKHSGRTSPWKLHRTEQQ